MLPEEFYCPGSGAAFEQSQKAFMWHTSWQGPTQNGAYPCRAVHTHEPNTTALWANQTGLTVPDIIRGDAWEQATPAETPPVAVTLQAQVTSLAVKPSDDPRSTRQVGTQSEVPTITAAGNNTRLIVRGYQVYELRARRKIPLRSS